MSKPHLSRAAGSVLWFFLSRHWRAYGFVAAIGILDALLGSVSITALFPLLTLILSGSASGSELPRWGTAFVTFSRQQLQGWDPLLAVTVMFVGLQSVAMIVTIANSALVARVSTSIAYAYRRQAFHIYSGASMAYLLERPLGELVYNVIGPPNKVGKVLLICAEVMLEGVRAILLVLVLFLIKPLLAVCILGISVISYVVVSRLLRHRVYNFSAVTRNALTAITALFSEFMTGLKQIRVAHASGAWDIRYDQQNRRLKDAVAQSHLYQSVGRTTTSFLVVLVLFGGVVALRKMHPAAFVSNLAFLGVAGATFLRLLPAITMMGQLPIEIVNNLPDVERLYDLLHTVTPAPKNGTLVVRRFHDAIQFHDVSFAYPGRAPLFMHLNVEFAKGQFSAVVGPSGSGKTTLIYLLLGLYRPASGQIWVDGVDLKDLDLATWYAQVGYVSQDMVLFNTSILENIRLLNQRYTRTEVERAARLSLCDEFVTTLPDGYETVIGERGMRLSGGQQQRLALARALLHNPSLVLLDEATSALDTASERLVQQAMWTASRERTVIAIAHRLSTIEQADVIYVLDHGQLVAQGRHHELMAQRGVYTTLQSAGAGNA